VDKKELARQIKKSSFLTGQFKLRSGKLSSFYWDKYRFETDPKLLSEIIEHMIKILPQTFDKFAGMELGGIPLATVLSLRIGKPCLFVRKKAKDYGTCNLIEGGFKTGETVLVVEDVITTAGQVVSSIEDMRKLGLIVKDVLCVIDREQGGREKLTEIKCSLSSLFTMTELERFNS
jgi:orotate phosphoribosyltransferase